MVRVEFRVDNRWLAGLTCLARITPCATGAGASHPSAAELVATIERVRESLNPSLGLEGVLLTMYDDRTNLGQQVSANIREYFGEKVYQTVIPRNVRLGEAPSHGVPVILYDARSRGAEAYVTFAHEFAKRRGMPDTPAVAGETTEP